MSGVVAVATVACLGVGAGIASAQTAGEETLYETTQSETTESETMTQSDSDKLLESINDALSDEDFADDDFVDEDATVEADDTKTDEVTIETPSQSGLLETTSDDGGEKLILPSWNYRSGEGQPNFLQITFMNDYMNYLPDYNVTLKLTPIMGFYNDAAGGEISAEDVPMPRNGEGATECPISQGLSCEVTTTYAASSTAVFGGRESWFEFDNREATYYYLVSVKKSDRDGVTNSMRVFLIKEKVYLDVVLWNSWADYEIITNETGSLLTSRVLVDKGNDEYSSAFSLNALSDETLSGTGSFGTADSWNLTFNAFPSLNVEIGAKKQIQGEVAQEDSDGRFSLLLQRDDSSNPMPGGTRGIPYTADGYYDVQYRYDEDRELLVFSLASPSDEWNSCKENTVCGTVSGAFTDKNKDDISNTLSSDFSIPFSYLDWFYKQWHDEPVTFTYTLCEQAPGDVETCVADATDVWDTTSTKSYVKDGVVYDASKYTVSVTISHSKADRQMASSVTYTQIVDEDGNKVSNGTESEDKPTFVNTRQGVTWSKVAEGTEELLGGSEWTITSEQTKEQQTVEDCAAASEDECTGLDKDPVAGQFLVRSLNPGTYQLRETKAPDGYRKYAKDYTFTITGEGSDSEVKVGPISNPLGCVKWQKVDSSSNKPIGESEWTITRVKNAQGEDVTEASIEVVDNGTNDQDSVAGQIHVTGLKTGTYRLVETKAPDGYQDSSKEYEFVISEDITTETADCVTVNSGVISNDRIVIESLPMTGGDFEATPYIAMGILLVAALALGVVTTRSKGGRI